MPQLSPYAPAVMPNGAQTLLNLDDAGNLLVSGISGGGGAGNVDKNGDLIISEGTDAVYSLGGSAFVVKNSPGRLVRFNVIAAGTSSGGIHDAANPGDADGTNLICAIPNAIGPQQQHWPCKVGITVMPGSGQVISLSYS